MVLLGGSLAGSRLRSMVSISALPAAAAAAAASTISQSLQFFQLSPETV